MDPRKNSSTEEEIANTPSDKGKKTDDGILGDLDFWQNRYSDHKTKYEQISLADAIETADEITESSTEEYEQTFFEGFDVKPKRKKKKSKEDKDEIDFLLEDAERLISRYDDDFKESKDIEEEKEELREDKKNSIEETESNPQSQDFNVEAPKEPQLDEESSEYEAVINEISAQNEIDLKDEDSHLEAEVTDNADDADSHDEAQDEDIVEDDIEVIPQKDEEEKKDIEETVKEEVLEDEKENLADELKEEIKAEDNLSKEPEDKEQQDKEPQKLTLISIPVLQEDEAAQKSEGEEKEQGEKSKEKKSRNKKEKEEKAEPQIISEYTDPNQKDIILKGLKTSLSKMNTVKAAVTVTFIISLIVTFIPSLFKLLSLDIPSFDTVGSIILTVINIVLLSIAVCFASQSFISGLSGFKRGITAHTVSSLTVIAALIQAVATIFSFGNSPIISYSYISVAIFSLLLNVSAEQKNIKRIITCFDFCAFTQNDALYSIRNIEGKEDSENIGKDLNMNDPKILYSGKIDFATDFLKGCKASNVSSSIIKRLLALSVVMSLLIAGLTSFVNQNTFVILAVFTGTFCLTSPFAVLYTLASTLLKVDKSLSSEGGVILSYPAAQECAQADAVAVDCADLFCRSGCVIKDINGTGAVRPDDVLLYSVAMILQSGGPLSEVFNSIIGGQRDILPRVLRLKYENRLGLSAKIYGHNVLLGSREMMIKNNIKMPDINEGKYKKNGYKLLYMSVDSVFGAYFVLKYQEDRTLNDSINEIQNRGVKLVMRTDDPNVTNEYVAQCFKLDKDYVKSTSDTGSDALRWYRNSLKDTDSAAVLHDGNPYSYFRTIVLCHRLRKFAGNIKTYSLLLSLLLCAGATAAVMLQSWFIFSPFAIIIIHAIALMLISLIQKLKI